jgi:hypothetical protein
MFTQAGRPFHTPISSSLEPRFRVYSVWLTSGPAAIVDTGFYISRSRGHDFVEIGSEVFWLRSYEIGVV